MKQKRNGFTLVEVMLFLGVSALLMLGVFGMAQTSIRAQRYNDSVQSFAEFLRRVYSEVANPQSIGDGRSDYAIYGKLVTFGEEYDLDGVTQILGKQKFFIYDVVGDSSGVGSGSAKDTLKSVKANVVIIRDNKAEPAGIVETYEPTWGAAIDTISNGTPFVGALLVVRHPRSGTISTLVMKNKTVQVNKILRTSTGRTIENLLSSQLDGFKTEQVDFCVNPDGYELKSNSIRRDVRIIKEARNASGVELIEQDSNENLCK